MDLDPQDLINDLTNLEKIALLLFHANNDEPIRDPLFYQKEFFLISNFILDLKDDADYIPSMLGPYSEPAEISLRNLKSYTLFDESGNKLDDKGKKIAEMLEKSISPEFIDAISDLKDFSNDLTKDELLAFIYLSFPEFTDESLILPDVIKDKIPNIVSLYRKGKISLAKAASLAGVCIEDFIKILKANSDENI